MKSFDDFLQKLLSKSAGDIELKIKGIEKKIKGMCRYTSNNYDFEYIKIVFEDHSHLIIVPSEKDIAYADGVLGEAEGISDEMIGNKEVNYKGKKYVLDNGDDYQFVLNHLVGVPGKDIEGEVRFSDYIGVDDDSEVLSLGWIVSTGKRADVLARGIDISDVEVVD